MSAADDYTANTFILVWDMYGLESCVNATQLDREKVWNTLANKDVISDKIGHIMNAFTMRARYNPQRHYEIYAIDVDAAITEDDLADSFKDDPQGMAELVRVRGRKLYSDRATDTDRVKIT